MVLSRIEEFVLLAVHELGEEASGNRLRLRVGQMFRRTISVGAIYVPLNRLVTRGYLTFTESKPVRTRGGRRKRIFSITGKGVTALREVRRLQEQAWAQVPRLRSV